MKQDNRQTQLFLYLFGILPVAWLGLLIAPAVSGGLPEIITAFPAAMNDPFHIVLCEDSLKTVLIALCAYGMGIGIYFPHPAQLPQGRGTRLCQVGRRQSCGQEIPG